MSRQLSDCITFDTNDLIFSDAKKAEFMGPGGKPMNYYRINISTKYPDGKSGDLIFDGDECFSFGITQNKSENEANDKKISYSLAMCLLNRDKPTEKQEALKTVIEEIIEACRRHLDKSDVKRSIAQPKLEYTDTKGMGKIIYQQLDPNTGEPMPDKGPMIYLKLINYTTKEGVEKMITQFYDINTGEPIDYMMLIGNRCQVIPAIKIESIYIGSGKFCLQVKLWEADVRVNNGGSRSRLMRRDVRPQASQGVDMNPADNFYPTENVQPQAEQQNSTQDDDQIQDTPAVPVKSTTVKKVASKKPAKN